MSAIDLLAVAVVLVFMVGLSSSDGGREAEGLRRVAGAALLSIPVVYAELRRRPPVWAVLVTAWCLAPLVVLASAVHRTQWVPPTLTMLVVPAVMVCVARLWRREWGPTVVGAAITIGMAVLWFGAFQVWWVTADGGAGVEWLALSWRNPSAALMGAGGLLLSGWAMYGSPVLRVSSALVAAICLAVVPLTGSRSVVPLTGVLFLALVAVLLAKAGSSRDRLVVAATGVAISLVAAMAFAAIGGMREDGTPVPSLERGTDLTASSNARVDHLRGAVGMFASSPVVGHGLGSYGSMSFDELGPGDALSDSAHNEYLEVLGEAGLVGGVPFLALMVGLAVAGLRRLRELRDASAPAPTAALLAAAGLVAVHSAWDFDWKYPVLVAVLGMGGGAALAGRGAAPTRRGDRVAGAAVASFTVLALVGTTGLVMQYAASPAPWEGGELAARAEALLEAGQEQEASSVVERGLAWNPTSTALSRVRAELGVRTGTDIDEIVALLPDTRRFEVTRFEVAAALAAAGHVDAGAALTAETDVTSGTAALEQEGARAMIAGARHGCAAVRAALDGAVARVEAAAAATQTRVFGVEDRVEAIREQAETAHCSDG